MTRPQPTLRQRLAAWAVHLYTASGAPLALLIVIAALQGDVRLALGLEFVTMVVDGTDGWLARRVQASIMVPFDGRKLDDIVDYLTYVFAPILLLWTAGYLPHGPVGFALAALPLLASCYQFCQAGAKTDDHYFLGFPSYWNILAFYIVIFAASPLVVAILLVGCSLLVFVPIKYVYPSRTIPFYRLTLTLTALWLAVYVVLVATLPHPSAWLTAASLLYALYYAGLSAYLTFATSSARVAVRDRVVARKQVRR